MLVDAWKIKNSIPPGSTFNDVVNHIKTHIRKKEVEFAFILDDLGNVKAFNAGDKESVSMDKSVLIEGFHLVHNHPEGSVLSVMPLEGSSDLSFLMYEKPKSITSVGRYGVDATMYYNKKLSKDRYDNFIKRGAGNSPSAYRQIYNRIYDELEEIKLYDRDKSEEKYEYFLELSIRLLRSCCDNLDIKYIIYQRGNVLYKNF